MGEIQHIDGHAVIRSPVTAQTPDGYAVVRISDLAAIQQNQAAKPPNYWERPVTQGQIVSEEIDRKTKTFLMFCGGTAAVAIGFAVLANSLKPPAPIQVIERAPVPTPSPIQPVDRANESCQSDCNSWRVF